MLKHEWRWGEIWATREPWPYWELGIWIEGRDIPPRLEATFALGPIEIGLAIWGRNVRPTVLVGDDGKVMGTWMPSNDGWHWARIKREEWDDEPARLEGDDDD